jgi:hypothetical protein
MFLILKADFDMEMFFWKLWDRSKITSHNLFAKVLKTLDILQTDCELIFEPTLYAY